MPRRWLPFQISGLDPAAFEDDVRHAGLDAPLADVGEAREEVEHTTVVGEHIGAKTADAPRLACLEEMVQEKHAESATLESVLDDEGDPRPSRGRRWVRNEPRPPARARSRTRSQPRGRVCADSPPSPAASPNRAGGVSWSRRIAGRRCGG